MSAGFLYNIPMSKSLSKSVQLSTLSQKNKQLFLTILKTASSEEGTEVQLPQEPVKPITPEPYKSPTSSSYYSPEKRYGQKSNETYKNKKNQGAQNGTEKTQSSYYTNNKNGLKESSYYQNSNNIESSYYNNKPATDYDEEEPEDDLDYDPKQEAQERFDATGNQAYLNGDLYPVGSMEHRIWASVFQPHRYKSFNYAKYKNLQQQNQQFPNQNNAGNNQYDGVNVGTEQPKDAVNPNEPVNGPYSTSQMQNTSTQTAPGNYNNQTNFANPSGQNTTDNTQPNTTNSSITNTTSSSITDTTLSTEQFSNEIKQITPSSNLKVNDTVVNSIKNQLKTLGKEFSKKETENLGNSNQSIIQGTSSTVEPLTKDEFKTEIDKLPNDMFKNSTTRSLKIAKDGYIEEDKNELPLSADEEQEVQQFFKVDPLVEAMSKKEKSIKSLLKSLNSLSEKEPVFQDIKNARKYARIFNTKLASLGEYAELTKPTLQDIKNFGKKASVRVRIKKY